MKTIAAYYVLLNFGKFIVSLLIFFGRFYVHKRVVKTCLQVSPKLESTFRMNIVTCHLFRSHLSKIKVNAMHKS